MLQQGQEEGQGTVSDPLEGFFQSIGSAFWDALEGLPLAEIAPVDQGSNSESNFVLPPTVEQFGRTGLRPELELVSSIKRASLRKVIHRSIIISDTNEAALRVARAIGLTVTGNRHSGTSCFVAFVPHLGRRPHNHIWHDCNPIQGMCRDKLLDQFRATGKNRNEDGFLATRNTVAKFRPLRSFPTEEARKEGDTYFERLLK